MPTSSDTAAEAIEKDVQKLCAELCLSGKCLFTATPTQLVSDGYLATAATAKLSSPTGNQSSAEGDTNTAGRDPIFDTSALLIPGKPHELLSDMKDLLLKRSVPPLHPLTLKLFDTITAAEESIKCLDPTFVSPIWQASKQRLALWGEYAHKRQLSKGRDAAAHVRTHALLQVLEHLYEAARLVVASRQAGLELAMVYLKMMNVIGAGPSVGVAVPLTAAWDGCRKQFKRCAHLKEVLLEQQERHGASLRCIVFSQQRVSAHILKHVIDNDVDLSSIKTAVVHATSSPATPRLSVTASDAAERLKAFKSGAVTVLLATSVAEEGMDVPAANCVVRFDEVQTAVSLVQSRGRARQVDSSFIVMKEDAKRSLSTLEEAEEEQRSVVAKIAGKGLPDDENLKSKRHQAQLSRIKNAQPILTRFTRDSGSIKNKALALLNEYAQKVAGEVVQDDSRAEDGEWEVTSSLFQYGMQAVQGHGRAAQKKGAANKAAFSLLGKLAK